MSIMLHGIGVSRGIGIGNAYVLYREQPEVQEFLIDEDQVEEEIQRYIRAKDSALRELSAIKERIDTKTPAEIIAFIDTHLLMIDDPVLNTGVIQHIKQHRNAEWALQIQCQRLIAVFNNMQDDYLKTRKDDIYHVVRSIQLCLGDENPQQQQLGDALKGRVIVADDLTPADTLLMKHQKIAGFITEYGGPLSHTAILARSLGIPALVGVHKARQLINANEQIVLDGKRGMLIIAPDTRSLKHFKALKRQEQQRKADLKRLANQPAVTQDQQTITLHGNIDRPQDVKSLRRIDETGVGLYRTEMFFISNGSAPDEDQQFHEYRKTVKALKGNPLTIRTLDLGADKEMKDTQQHGPLAHNPAMGLRAIRRCLKQPESFIMQLKAILRASAYGPIRMMIPMLTNHSEIDQILLLIKQAKAELDLKKQPYDNNIPVGAMIEVPAAALAADTFAERLDFLSIGTNDLIQYTLALDRLDDEVSYLYDPLHPSVLRLIDMTLQAGRNAGIPVSMCGEMASDATYTRLLLGLGLKYFSVPATALLEIKSIIINADISNLENDTRQILNLHHHFDITRAVNLLNSNNHQEQLKLHG
ncbi:MAG: phosphoenolpyruvate--protein phosphotransferase [Gammaproteobacteria bacterium]|nr:phosphoenolpyruvate--protein phosphotransferase [Gammaproteobacteria bacterium]